MFEKINQQKEIINCINEETKKILSFLIGNIVREEEANATTKVDCLLSRMDDNSHTLEDIWTITRQISEIILGGANK